MTGHVVTYGQFAALAKAQGWTAQFLAEKFRGSLEKPAEFFHRVLDPKNGDLVIPYRSVMDFYRASVQSAAGDPAVKRCACGCGRPLFGRKRSASGACRVRMHRRRSVTGKSDPKTSTEMKGFSVTAGGRPGECLDVTVEGPDGA
jgi:hypothetical protein